jgi:DNA-directed RNA polymerase specialized sigma24 family protein
VPDLQAYVGEDQSPEVALEVADELERLVVQFDDPTLRTITQRKFEGFTNEEIAKELDCSPRTVIRKLNRIRQEWEEKELSGYDSVDVDAT